jgi:hypothetical protein
LHARSALLRKAVWPLLLCATLALPFVLMTPHLANGALPFATLLALSALGTGAMAWACRSPEVEVDGLGLGSIIAATGAAIATVILFCCLTWWQGTAVGSLFDALVLAELRMSEIFWLAPDLESGLLVVPWLSTLAALSCAALLVVSLRRSKIAIRPALRAAVPLVKLTAVLGGWWSLPDSARSLSFVVPLLWVTLIPPDLEPWSFEQSFFRVLLCFVAVLAPLQAYPVAGTQVSGGTFLVVAAIALCAFDVIGVVIQRVGKGRSVSPWLELPAMAIVLLWSAAWRDPRTVRALYRNNVPLDLPGAAWVRLPSDQARHLQEVSTFLRDHCDSFVSLPGLDSFYFWTQLPAPSGWLSSDWQLVLTPQRQAQILAAMAAFERRCTLYDPVIANFWQRGRPLDVGPLVVFVRNGAGTKTTFNRLQVNVLDRRGPPVRSG